MHDTHTPPGQILQLRHMVNERVVRILLECILVSLLSVFFYNFGWPDYGVGSLSNILDMVKVTQFALSEGKIAVHCHAGLGMTLHVNRNSIWNCDQKAFCNVYTNRCSNNIESLKHLCN